MAAVLGLDLEAVHKVAAESADGEVCTVANDNDPSQVVVSGNRDAVMRAVENAKAAGAKRAVLLPVSAPFHCSLMEPAADRMANALSHVDIVEPKVPVVANVRATAQTSATLIRNLLVEQVTGSVRWTESIRFLRSQGHDLFLELGPGKVLAGLMGRIDPEAKVISAEDEESLEAAVAELKGG